jgi:K+-transporting ATPase ATPase C chain
MTIMTGVAYPLFVTLVAQISFPFKANGSFVHHKGSIVGSGLISQKFVSDIYFWPRPSAIDYNPLPSGGSNLGPISADLQAEVTERKNQLNKANPTAGNIPHDLLFASGSGLDPDISPEAARYQIDRVARARGLDAVQKSGLAALVEKCIQPRTLGIFGEPRVNVLHLNLAIDSSFAGRNP